MKITTKLALKYINKNKKRSISCIIGITLATILVTTIFAILSSFQEYMIDVERKDKNWEAEFISIPYSKVEEIAKDENIKEVSVYYEFGDSEDTLGLLQERIYLVAYDQNALKNANLILIEGRFPENEDEIIVSNYAVNNDTENPIYIGKKEIHKFNGEMKEFTIVGIVDGELEEDDITPEHIRIGQITYLDEAVLNEETIVNVRVLTNNVKRIYTTTQSLVKKLELKKFKNINKQITGEQSELLSGLINSMQEHMETEL